MKAVVRHIYGPPDVLKLEEIQKPTARDDEVLIRVHATSLNLSDWELLRGKPIWGRIWGPFKPKHKILGSDIAGRVEAVGKNATRFQIGDEVFIIDVRTITLRRHFRLFNNIHADDVLGTQRFELLTDHTVAGADIEHAEFFGIDPVIGQ